MSNSGVLRERSLKCEFTLPPELARKLRADNARRAAELKQLPAVTQIPEGLEPLPVKRARVVIQKIQKKVFGVDEQHENASKHLQSVSTQKLGKIGNTQSLQSTQVSIKESNKKAIEQRQVDTNNNGWIDAEDERDNSRTVQAVNNGVVTQCKASFDEDPHAKIIETDTSSEDIHWDADDTSPNSFAIRDATALAAVTAAESLSSAGNGRTLNEDNVEPDPDEPVLILDSAAIMNQGVELPSNELAEFLDDMSSSLKRNCDGVSESLFTRFREEGSCFYSTEFESCGFCRRLKRRFPDRKFCVLRFPREYLAKHNWRLITRESEPPSSQSLESLRLALHDCLRPFSWKVAMFEELQKLALMSEPGRRKREERERERAALRARGWDEDEDDDSSAFDDIGAFPSVKDFTVAKERKADVLDMILAMILQRQPPRSHRESESEHFTELAELHSEVRDKWTREHGDVPDSL